MPIFWTVRQYIFMVTDRHHLTGLNHKISSLPDQAELYPSQLAGSLTPRPHSSLLPPISRSLVGQQPANGRLTAGHVTRAPPPSGQGFPRSVVG